MLNDKNVMNLEMNVMQ